MKTNMKDILNAGEKNSFVPSDPHTIDKKKILWKSIETKTV